MMCKKALHRIIGFTAAAVMSLYTLVPSLSVSAEDNGEGNYTEVIPLEYSDSELDSFTEPEFTSMFSFPDNMRGVYITPGVDFPLYDDDGYELTEEELSAGIAEALDSAEDNSLNTVIIETSGSYGNYYTTDMNVTEGSSTIASVAGLAVSAASERGMYVYVTFDINRVLAGITAESYKEKIDKLALTVHEFAVKYSVDGIILDGYYSLRNADSFSEYGENGSGIGYDNWLYESSAYVFGLVADAVHRTDNTVPVGISLNDIWANYTTTEEGSKTSVSFEALTDGYADTVAYINNGYADFIIVKADGSLSSESMSFEEVVGWWNDIAAAAGVPMYVDHINEKICTDAAGWSSPDELVKQVIAAEEYDSYGGSVFNSLAALESNTLESTSVLIKHFEDKIDLEGLNNELEMTLPTSTTFKTEEPTVIFAGSFDPNFTIYFQGEPIELNEAGRFYFNIDLEVGLNTFTFENKGKVITYKITRTVNVLKSVEPSDGGEMRIEEQFAVTLSAIAYKGSDVTAVINGKTITLNPVEGQTDEIDPNSNYTKYVGTYVAPEGVRGQDIDLGNVTFYGTYHTDTGDFNETRVGSHIIVNALAEILNDYSGNLLEIKSDNTMVYNSKTTSTDPTPDMARLPAGTLDYQVNTVTYSGTEYYITNSGKRLRVSDVNVLENEPLGSNHIRVVSAAKDGTDTVLKLGLNKKIPFSMSFTGISYADGDNGNYYISSFDGASAVVLTFDYVTSISSGDITFPDSAVFTKGEWDTYELGELTKTTLTLYLRQSGIFGGITSSYDSEGNLVFRFNGCRSSVDGATIVIDPGHGYTGASEFDPGAVGHIKEQEANLAIAKKLESILTEMGANVIRLKTESETYVTSQRASIARQYDPDLYISIHCNSAGESAAGSEAYYFTPFSQPLAESITARVGSYLNSNVSTDSYDRGDKYNYFFVTQQQDFPSVLVECGFVTNYTEAMALADSTHQTGIAQAIANGISDYFSRCGYSSYGSGEGSWENYSSAVYTEEQTAIQTEAEAEQTTAASLNDPYYEYYETEQAESDYSDETAAVTAVTEEFYDPYNYLVS